MKVLLSHDGVRTQAREVELVYTDPIGTKVVYSTVSTYDLIFYVILKIYLFFDLQCSKNEK